MVTVLLNYWITLIVSSKILKDWLVVWNINCTFPFSSEVHHPNWRINIFQRPRLQPPTSPTSIQIHRYTWYIYIYYIWMINRTQKVPLFPEFQVTPRYILWMFTRKWKKPPQPPAPRAPAQRAPRSARKRRPRRPPRPPRAPCRMERPRPPPEATGWCSGDSYRYPGAI